MGNVTVLGFNPQLPTSCYLFYQNRGIGREKGDSLKNCHKYTPPGPQFTAK